MTIHMGRHATAVTRPSVGHRLAEVVRQGYFRRHETRLALLAGLGSVTVLVLLHWTAVAERAGAPGPVHHLAYLPILLAAYLFGVRGALLVVIVPVLVSGPFPILVKPDPATWAGDEGAVLRAAVFVLIALVTGALFDRMRIALDGWRTTAIHVAEREREGMMALARGAEAKDTDTGDHILRVQGFSERLALATGMARDEAAATGWAAMLHDIGKLRVPDQILLKPGRLTPDEEAIVRMHTIWGERILAEGGAYGTARHVARWHHEDFDGSGYPDGLRGEQIPLAARIVRIADAFDAMTHARRYKPARDLDETVSELERCAGRQFDPELLGAFIDLLDADPTLANGILSSDATPFRPEHLRLTVVEPRARQQP